MINRPLYTKIETLKKNMYFYSNTTNEVVPLKI